jgi:hypothetical protein
MLKSEDSIWYRKYSIELRERQFLEAKIKKFEEMNSNLETQLRQSKYSRRGSTAIIN